MIRGHAREFLREVIFSIKSMDLSIFSTRYLRKRMGIKSEDRSKIQFLVKSLKILKDQGAISLMNKGSRSYVYKVTEDFNLIKCDKNEDKTD